MNEVLKENIFINAAVRLAHWETGCSSWCLTCEHNQAGGLHEWPLPAQPSRTEPLTHQIDPHIDLVGTSSHLLVNTPLPENAFAHSQRLAVYIFGH